ncbi:MAG: hypothetical protein J6A89_08910 [Clostridia bacterium]|nr:hypothetical protein [Clostridia bacterium]
MLKTNYANAYKEVLIILDNLIKEDYDKIPKEYIEFLKSNCNNEYEFYYDNSKTFEEQELLDNTKYILFGLFEKFGATEIQKEKIKNFKDNYFRKIEEEKREQYNPDDIFKNANKAKNTDIEMSENNTNTVLIECKGSFFTRFKNFIFKILHINK